MKETEVNKIKAGSRNTMIIYAKKKVYGYWTRKGLTGKLRIMISTINNTKQEWKIIRTAETEDAMKRKH